jgi:transcriptional regulator with XRE-family HTH domain
MISYYENGTREVPFEIISKLSDLYGIELELFYEENPEILNENIAFAFRTDGFDKNDLESIAEFKAIIKNYLKINRLLNRE